MNEIVTIIEENSLHESAPWVNDSFPFRTCCSDIQDFACHAFPWHWHEEVEILYLVEGKMLVKIPDAEIVLREGDILFIPSNVLHSSEAMGEFPGVHTELIFSPFLIGGSWNSIIMQKYVLPLIHAGADFIIVKHGSPSNARLQELINAIHDTALAKADGFEIHVRRMLEELWMIIRENVTNTKDIPAAGRQNQGRLMKMLEFIQNHYSEDILLKDIADAAGISERECNRCFRKTLRITTIEYLLQYRINRALDQLMNTNLPITVIGQNCGFSSASYFTKRFREKTGMTPKEYRNA